MSEKTRMLLGLAYKYAKFSKDPSTQAGAIACRVNGSVVAGDCNRLSIRCRLRFNRRVMASREQKNMCVMHAEELAAWEAYALGAKGLVLYSPWACCGHCASVISITGFSKVVCHKQCMDKTPERWLESVQLGHEILAASGIEIECYDGKIGGTGPLLFNGELWEP